MEFEKNDESQGKVRKFKQVISESKSFTIP